MKVLVELCSVDVVLDKVLLLEKTHALFDFVDFFLCQLKHLDGRVSQRNVALRASAQLVFGHELVEVVHVENRRVEMAVVLSAVHLHVLMLSFLFHLRRRPRWISVELVRLPS